MMIGQALVASPAPSLLQADASIVAGSSTTLSTRSTTCLELVAAALCLALVPISLHTCGISTLTTHTLTGLCVASTPSTATYAVLGPLPPLALMVPSTFR